MKKCHTKETEHSLKLICVNDEIRVQINIIIANEELTLTVDTGAQISILKPHKLYANTKIKFKEKVHIIGIAKDKSIESIGRAYTKIKTKDNELLFGFHIIREPINIKTDGIIGNDFLEQFAAIIDYRNKTLNLITKKNEENDSINKNEPHEKEITKKLLNDESFREALHEYEEAIREYKQISNSRSKHGYQTIYVNERNKSHKIANENFYDKIDPELIEQKCTKYISPTKIETSKTNFIGMFYNTNRNKEIILDNQIEEVTNPETRKKYLMENLNLTHCSEIEKTEVEKLCATHSKAFYIDGDPFKHTNITEHIIKLKPNTKPIYTRQYRIPDSQKPEIEKQIKELLKNRVIEKSNSAWNSPLILVPKKDNEKGEKQYRMVIDYRKVNSVTEPQTFPIPLIDEIIESMTGSTLFTTLDLQNAFHQVPLHKDSRELTAFSTSWQKYQFTSTPFGLTGSPFTWLRTIHTVLDGLLGKGVEVYMDDVLIHTKTLEKHTQLLSEVMKRLIDNNLKLKISKSAFMQKHVKYLGFIISAEGVEVDPQKTQCIREYPRPKNIKEIQRFVAMCNYFRKHVPGFAQKAKPMYSLLKKDVPFMWNDACEKGFNFLKQALITPPVLIYPNYSETFIITTDSSDTCIGSMLSQGDIPNDKPIMFYSKVLNEAQQRYPTVEKELLAIISTSECAVC